MVYRPIDQVRIKSESKRSDPLRRISAGFAAAHLKFRRQHAEMWNNDVASLVITNHQTLPPLGQVDSNQKTKIGI